MGGGLCASEQAPPEASPRESRPNVLFILCDDLGYGDLGVLFQNERQESRRHSTPHMDRLAREGRILLRHYCPAPVCAPSRASLMSGQHQGHASIRDNQFDKALPEGPNMASLLQGAGYRTALIGKWGLQGNGESPATWPAYPTKRGFDEFFGYVRHRDGHSHYPAHKTEARGKMELYDGQENVSAQLTGCYTTDLFTARAKKFLAERAAAESSQPFFLLLTYDTPHAALHVPAAPYPEGSGMNGGVQWLGEPGAMINTAAEPIDSFLHPDYRGQEWTDSEKRFATMVRRLDDGVGDLMQTLDDLGLTENTLLVLTSDNGPHNEAYTPGRRYGADRFDSFGPLDGIKRDVYEGGIRVPTIARWPGEVPAGSSSPRISQFHDWLPTLLELGGARAPSGTDGVSMAADLRGDEQSPVGTVYVEYTAGGKTPGYEEFDPRRRGAKRGQMQAIYLDGYKGVRTDIQSHEDPFQIYETLGDPGESHDLAGTSPFFERLNISMRKEVLRIRRPNPSAPRPYDHVPMPSLRPHRESLDEVLTSIEREVLSETRDTSFGHQTHVSIRTTGRYTFHLHAPGGAVFRLHRAIMIDSESQPSEEVRTASVLLEAGQHVVSVDGQALKGRPAFELTWEGPER
ncbi:Arylsulfatase [Planctomycetes bacterium Poly30]|uniref:Arylsulfatase n=2 Tax=Saltatorellus ferox TaxID=2528018 RepID=A0A518EW42_9BACT|nr:Arylsulfatase [Planctomycetes bacterium Poly30]